MKMATSALCGSITGSCPDGKLDYTNEVVGPITLSRNRQYYTENLLVKEALDLAVKNGLDLKKFDSRGVGIVDAMSFLYAGQTQYLGELWPHNYFIELSVQRYEDLLLHALQHGSQQGGALHWYLLP